MTRRANIILTLSAAAGAGFLAASAFAQQPAAAPPAASTQTAPTTAAPTTDRGPGMMRGRGAGRASPEDRAAYFDAHLASVHAGLKLTPDQERLWPPVEAAVRDMAKSATERRAQRLSQPAPTDPVERMARLGDLASKRGAAITRLADAAKPLYASLSEDQKRRLRVLMRTGAGMMMADEDRRAGGRHHEGMTGGRQGRHDGRGRDDNRRGWNDWR